MVMHASGEYIFRQLPGGLSKLVHFKLKRPIERFRSPWGRVCVCVCVWIQTQNLPEFLSLMTPSKGRFFFFFLPFPLCQSLDKQV